MARYRATQPCCPNGSYLRASVTEPVEFTIDDDRLPSRTWLPLDASAQKALQRLGQMDYERRYASLDDEEKKKFPKPVLAALEKARQLPPLADGARPAPKVEPEAATMAEMQTGARRRGRPSDSEPV